MRHAGDTSSGAGAELVPVKPEQNISVNYGQLRTSCYHLISFVANDFVPRVDRVSNECYCSIAARGVTSRLDTGDRSHGGRSLVSFGVTPGTEGSV